MKRSLIILLIAAMLLPCLFLGCDNQEPEATTPVVTTPEVTTPETTTPEEEIVEPPYDGPDITPEGVLKRASIVTTGSTESELYAAEELAKYLSMKKIEVKDGAFPITLSIDEALENDAFVITATLSGDGAGMTIAGGNERGVLYGVYKFLEELGGVRYFMPGLETVPDSEIILKDGVVLEYTPFFESRRMNWNCIGGNSDWCVKQGVNTNNADMSGKYGGAVTYGSGLFVHTLGALTETGDGLSPNPCLSLDSPEGQKNFQTTLKNLRAALEKEPTMNIASVSQNDKNEYCQCDYCKASYEYYTYHTGDVNDEKYVTNCAEKGGAAGNLLAFVNAIAEGPSFSASFKAAATLVPLEIPHISPSRRARS
ncbi:MAG: DUF4838 domain-containing protein [Clostridia bacterium]|nr:DUF4838 domain-containing protein [Clostridia bacterium]